MPGQIDIHFEFYPQRQAALPNAGTLVAVEGDPGYPSTGTRGAYLALFEPLRADRHLLLVADDLAADLGALGIDRVDLDGDSYGTFFAQTFAGIESRHRQLDADAGQSEP